MMLRAKDARHLHNGFIIAGNFRDSKLFWDFIMGFESFGKTAEEKRGFHLRRDVVYSFSQDIVRE